MLAPSEFVFCPILCAENKWCLIAWRKIAAHSILPISLLAFLICLRQGGYYLAFRCSFPVPVLLTVSEQCTCPCHWNLEAKRIWATALVDLLLPRQEEAAGRVVCQVLTPLVHYLTSSSSACHNPSPH